MEGMKREILALSGMMPPLVFPRSLQISRILDSLGRVGWNSDVVTVEPESEIYGAKDDKLAEFYEGAYRCFPVEPREEVQPSPIWVKVRRKLRPPRDFKTDNWEWRSLGSLRRLTREKAYDVFISFGQPWCNHKIGLRFKKTHPKMPWIAHFSDPWVDSPYAEFSDEEHRQSESDYEAEVVEKADAIVFINERTADLVMSKYPAALREKVSLIPHAFDRGLVELLGNPPSSTGERMKVVHAGNFYSKRSPESFLRALAKLESAPDLKGVLEVEFIGQSNEAIIGLVKELGLDPVVRFGGVMGYLDALTRARAADLLLVIDASAENSVFLPSKLVDYLMLEKRIFGITPREGCSADVLAGLDYPVAPPDEIPAIAAAMRREIESWKADPSGYNKTSSGQGSDYEISHITSLFDDLLRKAIATR